MLESAVKEDRREERGSWERGGRENVGVSKDENRKNKLAQKEAQEEETGGSCTITTFSNKTKQFRHVPSLHPTIFQKSQESRRKY